MISIETQCGDNQEIEYIVRISEREHPIHAHSINEVNECVNHYLGHMHSTYMSERKHCPLCRDVVARNFKWPRPAPPARCLDAKDAVAPTFRKPALWERILQKQRVGIGLKYPGCSGKRGYCELAALITKDKGVSFDGWYWNITIQKIPLPLRSLYAPAGTHMESIERGTCYQTPEWRTVKSLLTTMVVRLPCTLPHNLSPPDAPCFGSIRGGA